MSDYVSNQMLQRPSNFLEDSWHGFPMFFEEESTFIYCTLRERWYLSANSLKQLCCPKALTEYCSAQLIYYYIKREQMTLEFGHLSLMGFSVVLRKK